MRSCFQTKSQRGVSVGVSGRKHKLLSSFKPIHPGTDTAFLMGVVYEMLKLEDELGGTNVLNDSSHGDGPQQGCNTVLCQIEKCSKQDILPPEDITHPGTIIKAKAAAGNPDFKQVIL